MRYTVLLLSLIGLLHPELSAQENKHTDITISRPESEYDKDLLSPSFHKGRRQAFRDLMPEGSVAVFFANPVRNRSNDVDFEYHQNPDFYYLTGLREPDAMLVILKNQTKLNGTELHEFILVRERDRKKEIWNGRRLGIDGTEKELEIKPAYPGSKLEDLGIDWSQFSRVMVHNLRSDVADDPNEKGDLFSLMRHFTQSTEGKGLVPDDYASTDIMARLREVKLPEELALMRKAIDITCIAHRELMRALEPGFSEYQSEAIIEYFFKKYGAEHWGFPSILGGGENSCILHYTTNRKMLNNDELMVVDIGAEYHGYTADVTRTLPVKGTFSPEQLQIYNIVLEAQTAGINACIAGNRFSAPHKAAYSIISNRLIELGIIKSPQEAQQYFMHGTSHYLGLDVHDAGLYGDLAPGNVITVEPGIYIPEGSPCDAKWWKIGIRIEDDILITEGAPENLSISAPRKAADVEKLMAEPSLFNVIK